MQFIPTSVEVSVFFVFVWMCSNGGPAVIYLTMNSTIRHGVIQLVINALRDGQSSSAVMSTVVTNGV
ncbi:hypothetical protein L596_021002 [Steinernema carpocapsae]|uniref:7TM GPCR serpentine receptor class x (Srx) domain-containing protein n=1 Tax=Steinernema carpocapsae TaxID=34508 RepID=A0A4U5MVE9_STECR|nr:hypothetical protein L596_021002 [Steinernema carpocapsae]